MLGAMEILVNTEHDNGDCSKVGLPKNTGLHFCFSRDGRTFAPRAEPDIAPEGWGSGAWDTGYLSATGGVCVVKDERLWFYYSGLRGDRRSCASPAGTSPPFPAIRCASASSSNARRSTPFGSRPRRAGSRAATSRLADPPIPASATCSRKTAKTDTPLGR